MSYVVISDDVTVGVSSLWWRQHSFLTAIILLTSRWINKCTFGTRKTEVLNSLVMNITAKANLLHRANATQFNKTYRRASNVTKLFSVQTLASQPRSSGWLSQPWGHWQWQQLTTAANSWIFVDSRTQTRAECKHPVDTSMHFLLVTELHASLMTSRAITIGAYPAESCDYVCFVPLRHYRNSLLRFSFFTALFSWMTNKNLQQDHCSSICNALMMITGVIETFAICQLYRFLCPWFSTNRS